LARRAPSGPRNSSRDFKGKHDLLLPVILRTAIRMKVEDFGR
jgi:hypothetical protein